jgi:hypothetical protein
LSFITNTVFLKTVYDIFGKKHIKMTQVCRGVRRCGSGAVDAPGMASPGPTHAPGMGLG